MVEAVRTQDCTRIIYGGPNDPKKVIPRLWKLLAEKSKRRGSERMGKKGPRKL